MQHSKQFLRLWLTLLFGVMLGCSSVLAGAVSAPTPSLAIATQPDVLITEVQTASATSASEEFIEFYNTSDHDIDFADMSHAGKNIWKLQYFTGSKLPASGVADWTKPTGTIDLSAMTNKVIASHDYYVLAGTKTDGSKYEPGGIEPDGSYSSRFSDAAALQLVDVAASTAVTTVHDRLTWSKAVTIDGMLLAPPAGSSLQRIPNDDDEYLGQAGTIAGFEIEAPASPRDRWIAPTPVLVDDPSIPDPTIGDTDQDSSAGTTNSVDPTKPIDDTKLLAPVLTELLPNPAAPQTDASDEFIELYNPNPSAFDLAGYSLETGTTTLHDFTFSEHPTIAGNSYEAFYSSTTHLSLSNSSGQARLLAPGSKVVSQSDSYGTANDGQAWALIGNVWQWTSTPTPNAANVAATSTVISKNVTTTKTLNKTTSKSTSKVKGVSTTKLKKVKLSKPKTKKAKKVKTATASHLASIIKPTPIHSGVLAVVATVALLYGLYEYRVDLANRFYQLREHYAARHQDRPQTKRR